MKTDSSKFSLNRFTIICKNWHIPPIKAKFPLAISEENRLRECEYLSQPSTFIHLGNYHFIMLSKRACREIHHWWTNHHGSPPPLIWVWGASSCPCQAFVTVIWQGPEVQKGCKGNLLCCATDKVQPDPTAPPKANPESWTHEHPPSLQTQLASAPQTCYFTLKAAYLIRRSGKIEQKKLKYFFKNNFSLTNACYSAKIRRVC